MPRAAGQPRRDRRSPGRAPPPACRAAASAVSSRRNPAARSSWVMVGIERTVLVVRRAEQAQAGVRLARSAARAGSGRDAICRCPARPTPARHSPRQPWPAASGAAIAPAPRRGRRAACRSAAQCREAALDGALAQYPRGDDRRGKALDLDRAEILVVEQPAGQPPRARRDHHRPRLGQRLQPRREVRRLADHRLLLRRALADQIADHHEPGGDPDPHLQRRPRAVSSPATASTSFSPARTARSASCSSARG